MPKDPTEKMIELISQDPEAMARLCRTARAELDLQYRRNRMEFLLHVCKKDPQGRSPESLRLAKKAHRTEQALLLASSVLEICEKQQRRA